MAAGSRDTKVVLVGGMGVGKTCLSVRLSRGEFCGDIGSTLGASLVSFPSESGGEINIWDTAGQERFRSLTSIYYQGAKLMLLCFSLAGLQEEQLRAWIGSVKSKAPEGAKLLLVGTKLDTTTTEKADGVCRRALDICAELTLPVEGGVVWQTSAKTGAGIAALKAQLQALCEPVAAPRSRTALGLFSSGSVEVDDATAPSRGCCS